MHHITSFPLLSYTTHAMLPKASPAATLIQTKQQETPYFHSIKATTNSETSAIALPVATAEASLVVTP